MVLDSLDGRVARMTNTQSAFGEQMDSLSDMVSFGAAPAGYPMFGRSTAWVAGAGLPRLCIAPVLRFVWPASMSTQLWLTKCYFQACHHQRRQP